MSVINKEAQRGIDVLRSGADYLFSSYGNLRFDRAHFTYRNPGVEARFKGILDAVDLMDAIRCGPHGELTPDQFAASDPQNWRRM